ncbi:MAG: GNAT family protein [Pseudomonadota bacterium]
MTIQTDSDPDSNLGAPVPNWSPPPFPGRSTLQGRYCRLEPLDPARHAQGLFDAWEGDDALWDYMPIGPFATAAEYRVFADQVSAGADPQFYAVCDLDTGAPLGQASYLRIAPEAGSIEVGWICFSPRLKRSRLATEAMYLMMKNAFDLGYRRYEWKCNALNAASRRAAQRFGFSFEGVFRQATVSKGRNRDTAWYATIDSEWPALNSAFEQWLDPANFDAAGRQYRALSTLTEPCLFAKG